MSSSPFFRLLGATLLLLAAVAIAQDPAPYPSPPSKKGLQVQMVDDALVLGIHHAGLNCDLHLLMDLEGGKFHAIAHLPSGLDVLISELLPNIHQARLMLEELRLFLTGQGEMPLMPSEVKART